MGKSISGMGTSASASEVRKRQVKIMSNHVEQVELTKLCQHKVFPRHTFMWLTEQRPFIRRQTSLRTSWDCTHDNCYQNREAQEPITARKPRKRGYVVRDAHHRLRSPRQDLAGHAAR